MSPTRIQGQVEPGFGPVADAMAINLAERGELGASLAIVVEGHIVVDVHGGVADRRATRPWTNETLAPVFSTTKGMAAIVVALLVDRGRLDYEDPVARHWPELAAARHGELTVGDVLAHRSGLSCLDAPLTLDQIIEGAPVVTALADQAPLWEPGTEHGYHALTYGWLVGELVARTDGRSLGQVLADEVAGPLGLDTYIGLPPELEDRVAELVPAGRPDTPEELELMRRIAGPGTEGGRALTLDGAMLMAGRELVWNRADVHASEMPAANGITDARSLARLYAATIGELDGVRLVSPATMEAARTERSHGPDRTLVLDTRFGAGFMLEHPTHPLLAAGSFGHWGAGGSLGFADPEHGVAVGYVMNKMGGGIAGDPRAVALIDALRRCL